MEKKKWKIVVSGSESFKVGVNVFFDSFEAWHDYEKYEVYFISPDLEIDRPYVINVKTEHKDKPVVWQCKIERFKLASELKGIVGMFDADMMFCENIDWMFEIAECGKIVAGANGSIIGYNNGWRVKYEIPEIPDMVNYKTITSVPTIMNVEKHGEVWRKVYEHKCKGIGADFDLINVFMTICGKLDDIVVIPSQQITGIHHFQVKPNTRIFKKHDGRLFTQDGLVVYIIHGRWFQPNYREAMLNPMKRFCKGDKSCLKGADDSKRIILEEYDRYVKGN